MNSPIQSLRPTPSPERLHPFCLSGRRPHTPLLERLCPFCRSGRRPPTHSPGCLRTTSPIQLFRPMPSYALAQTPSNDLTRSVIQADVLVRPHPNAFERPHSFIHLGQFPRTSSPEHLRRTSLVQSCIQVPSHALPVWLFRPTPLHALARTPSYDQQLCFLCLLRLHASAQESICTLPNFSLPKHLAFLARMNTWSLCWNDFFRLSNALLIWWLAHQLGCRLTKLTHRSVQLTPLSCRPMVWAPMCGTAPTYKLTNTPDT